MANILASPLLLAIYDWRTDVKNHIDCGNQPQELRQQRLLKWWLTWGHLNYTSLPVECGLTKWSLARYLYSLDTSLKDTAPPFYSLFCGDDNQKRDDVRSEVVQSLYESVYTNLLKARGKFDEVLAGRALGWAESNKGVISSNTLKAFRRQVESCFGSRTASELADRYQYLVNVVGNGDSSIGIGVDTQLVLRSLEKARIVARYVQANSPPYAPINLFLGPPPDLAINLAQFTRSLPYSINICACPWELPRWPHKLEYVLDAIDKIFVYTDFVKCAVPLQYIHKTTKITLPVCVPGGRKPYTPRQNINTRSFAFLSLCDLASYAERKNPSGSIKAFKLAFPKGNEATELWIKINNGSVYPESLEKLKAVAGKDTRIRIIDEKLSPADLADLFNKADAFLSLHRSEGFGRVIAEMMLLGKPVIVTAYSGNCDFTKHSNAWLVAAKLVDVKRGEYIFTEGQKWADPNYTQAAKSLRAVARRPALAKRRANVARRFIKQRYSVERAGQSIKTAIAELLRA